MNESVKKDNLNRSQKAKARHLEASEQRKVEVHSLQVLYKKHQNNPVVKDLLQKCHLWVLYHTKVAKDGTAYSKEGQEIALEDRQILAHLHKASGIEEILNYAERMINPPEIKAPKPAPIEE